MTSDRHRAVRCVLVVSALAVAAGCGGGASRDTAATDVIAVTTQTARVTTLRETISVAGTVVPQAAADFIVTAREPCDIAELPKEEGDTVQAGDVVARFDVAAVTAELATRQLEVAEAAARHATAKAEADRVTNLVNKGLSPRNQLETVRAALVIAETNLSQAQSRLDVAKAAEAATIIRAPFTGVVVKRWHGPGDQVTGLESDPVLRIVDPGRMQLAAQVATADAGRIQPGQTADVQTGTGAAEPAVVAAKITPPTAGAAMTDLRLTFIAPTTLPLDTPVQVDILVNERRDALVIPADAVQRADTVTFVWVATDNNQASQREVRVGFIANRQAQIVSGLTAGEAVIVTGIAQLTEGARISITK